MLRSPHFFLAAFGAASLLVASAPGDIQPAAPNLVAGLAYEMDPAPRYPHTTGPDDQRDLTDGVYAKGIPDLWTHRSAVGWMFSIPIVTFDLGKAQEISGLGYSTAAGDGGVSWPRQILVFVSDDKASWRFVGDAVPLSQAKKGGPSSGQGASKWKYVTSELHAKGRYIAIAIEAIPSSENYVFSDEIELYGDSRKAAVESSKEVVLSGTGIPAIREFLKIKKVDYSIRQRFTRDRNAIQALLKQSSLSQEQLTVLEDKIHQAEQQFDQLPSPNPETYETVLPLNPPHAMLLGAYGKLLQYHGLRPLFTWKQHRYTLPPYLKLEEKPGGEQTALVVEMLKNEVRADSFLLTNATDKQEEITARFTGLPSSVLTSLQISLPPWTDTLQGEPVVDALPEPKEEGNSFRFSIPAGFTQKCWLTVDSARLSPGRYEGGLEIEMANGSKLPPVPVSIRISSVVMARPRLSLGMWDYANATPTMGLTARNIDKAMASMRSHFVDTAWSTGIVLPQPTAANFDSGKLVRPLDFTALDAWIKRWPDARHYFVFANSRPEFAGEKMGTPEFNLRVGEWARALSERLRLLQIKPEQFAIELVDETHTEPQDAIIIAWAKAIKAAVPELQVFSNPTWIDPAKAPNQEAFTLPDILCPYIIKYQEGGEKAAAFFSQPRRPGQKLWFYQCAGPARLLDPTRYHRGQAWWAFSHGAVGIMFWCFTDIGGGKSSWNEYGAVNRAYAPPFIKPDDVTDSIHWQSVREGVEDYECLSMVRDALGLHQDKKWQSEAKRLLEKSANVLGSGPLNSPWKGASRADALDELRLEALHLLESADKNN
jgi:hypothetical protein